MIVAEVSDGDGRDGKGKRHARAFDRGRRRDTFLLERTAGPSLLMDQAALRIECRGREVLLTAITAGVGIQRLLALRAVTNSVAVGNWNETVAANQLIDAVNAGAIGLSLSSCIIPARLNSLFLIFKICAILFSDDPSRV